MIVLYLTKLKDMVIVIDFLYYNPTTKTRSFFRPQRKWVCWKVGMMELKTK